ncbi:MAG TPA: RsmG family class I SAM-dependent methyltransferase [bacterium]|nr:RsmG family class I SAM-dependent methyltransferase [bacterium]
MDFSLPAVLDSPRFSRALEVVESVVTVPESGTLVEFLELLVRWNRRINLVSRASDPTDLLADALVDAAALTRILETGDGTERSELRPRRTVADLGAGAGLLSVALALLAPGLDLVLVESNTRKAGFLRRVAALLADRGTGGFEVEDARLEELEEGPRRHRLWRAAFSRAVWPPEEGWGRAAPHLIPGGLYIALTGPDATAPQGWSRSSYADLFPHPEGYSSRRLLWRYK